MGAPLVFISYSHDSTEHKQWVLRLATDLRTNGIDATLDQWDLQLGQDVTAFMQSGIVGSDRVLLVCSDEYVRKAEAGSGGVGYERLIVTAELVQNIDTKKFIPLVRNGTAARKVPVFLGPRLYIDFNAGAEYGAKLDELLRELHGRPASTKPALGINPFSGAAPAPPERLAGPSGVSPAGIRILDEVWFQEQSAAAAAGLTALHLPGSMELRFALHAPVGKSQIELLNAVRQSEIHTFGWPIAVLLENRPEYRPRPTAAGIRAEVSIADKSISGRPSYDYWAVRNNGDFYLLQSLFEDERADGKLFFNTRIVRVTEALLFCSNLYSHLGAPQDAKLSVRVTHSGLASRQLTSSSPNRHVWPSTSSEDKAQAEIVVARDTLSTRLTEAVRQITEPMFMLFDFKEFPPQVYEDIVQRFVKGEVS